MLEKLKQMRKLIEDYGPDQLGTVDAGLQDLIKDIEYQNEVLKLYSPEYRYIKRLDSNDLFKLAMRETNKSLRRYVLSLLEEREEHTKIFSIAYNL